MILYKISKEVGNIANAGGGLRIAEENGKYFWGIENGDYSEIRWEVIPESLYNELIALPRTRMYPEEKDFMTEKI